MNLKQIDKIDSITEKYGIELLSGTTNIQGTLDIVLSHRINQKELNKMEKELYSKVKNLNDISYGAECII